MATFERIDQELKERLDEATKNLKTFEEGEDDGKWLKKLRRKLDEEEWRNDDQKERWEDSLKKLEEEKAFWRGEVKKWGDALLEFGEGKGKKRLMDSEDIDTAIKKQKAQEENVTKIQEMKSPSVASVHSQYRKHQDLFKNHRPNFSWPVNFYHNIFNKFLQDYNNKNLVVSEDILKLVGSFVNEMSQVYRVEDGRQEVVDEYIYKLFGYYLEKRVLSDKSSNDGMIRCQIKNGNEKTGLTVISEIKNEVGVGHSDPYLQGNISYSKYWTQEKDEITKVRKVCNCPCFIIAIAGPWLCISGAVYLDRPVVDPLTPYVPLIPTKDEDYLYYIAQMFEALRQSVHLLREFYEQFDLTNYDLNNIQRFFPYFNQFESDNKVIVRFTYDSELTEEKNLWNVHTNDNNHQLIVKFAKQYNPEAHQLCAEHGFAPRLLYYNKDEIYGWHIIVMEYIDGRMFSNVTKLTKDKIERILQEVYSAMQKLHEKKLVFGDLRKNNIMIQNIDGVQHVKLVDFDWCGIEGQDCYPAFINHYEINWPSGVSDKKPLYKSHDKCFFNMLCDEFDMGHLKFH